MENRYKSLLILLGLLLVAVLLCGCAEEKVEDNGELIQKPPAQIEMYI
jgi:hypothetical protein